MENRITIGIPKGSLQESTLALFSRAGFSFFGSERSLWLTSNDPELKPVLLRPQEIPLYVANGSLDCGLSGTDWITETNCNKQIHILADLSYSKRTFSRVRWVFAVANDSPHKTLEDLRNKGPSPLRVSTELITITENWLAENGIIADVSFSWGATEAKVPVFADAIVECSETGTSLRENELRVLDTVFVSTTHFFSNKSIYKNNNRKRTKLNSIALLLKSCLAADKKVGIHVQIPSDKLEIIKALIPSGALFSIWESQNEEMFIEIVIEKEKFRELMPVLVRNGAKKISVQSLWMLYE